MKKIIIGILLVVIGALAAVGIGMAIKSCNEKAEENKNNITCTVTLLEDEYAKGDTVMFRCEVTADVELTSLVYVLNADDDVAVTVKTALTEDVENAKGDGEYYIDSGVEMIDTTDMNVGNYSIQFYGLDAEGTRYEVSDVFNFKLVTVAVAE